jgi:hypothetical protein
LNIAAGIRIKFAIVEDELKMRHRGTAASDASNALVSIAAKEYRVPLHVVADYLGVGRTAASALLCQGKML